MKLIVCCSDRYAKLSEKAKDTLAYLIHSKEHVLQQGSKDESIEEALRKYSTLSAKPLYRGCSAEEYAKVVAGKPVVYYMSFSEDRAIAERFGPKLITLHMAKGFNYGQYLVQTMKALRKTNPDEFEQSDGDFLIESAEEEKEWILPFGLRFVKTDKGFTVAV